MLLSQNAHSFLAFQADHTHWKFSFDASGNNWIFKTVIVILVIVESEVLETRKKTSG